MAEKYLIANGAAPTTAAMVPVTTGTSIKTMLQVKLAATGQMRASIIEWGISFDGFAAALPIRVELFANTDGATVTQHVAAGIVNLDPLAQAPTDDNPFALGAATETGFTSSNEQTPAGIRMFDVQFVAPTNQYVKQWPLGREPMFQDTEFVKIRVTAGTAVNCYCYFVIEV